MATSCSHNGAPETCRAHNSSVLTQRLPRWRGPVESGQLLSSQGGDFALDIHSPPPVSFPFSLIFLPSLLPLLVSPRLFSLPSSSPLLLFPLASSSISLFLFALLSFPCSSYPSFHFPKHIYALQLQQGTHRGRCSPWKEKAKSGLL